MPRKPKEETALTTSNDSQALSPTLEQPSDSGIHSYISEAQRNILLQSTPNDKVRTRQGRGTAQLRYVDHAYVTEQLNLAFGWNWDFKVVHENLITAGKDNKIVEVSVMGELSVRLPGGTIITKQQYGAQTVEYSKSDPFLPVSLGDAKKGAASDALKKCASLLGIALDLYDTDGDIKRDRDSAISSVQPFDVRFVLAYLNKCKELGFVTADQRVDLKAIEAAGGTLYSPEIEESLLERLAAIRSQQAEPA